MNHEACICVSRHPACLRPSIRPYGAKEGHSAGRLGSLSPTGTRGTLPSKASQLLNVWSPLESFGGSLLDSFSWGDDLRVRDEVLRSLKRSEVWERAPLHRSWLGEARWESLSGARSPMHRPGFCNHLCIITGRSFQSCWSLKGKGKSLESGSDLRGESWSQVRLDFETPSSRAGPIQRKVDHHTWAVICGGTLRMHRQGARRQVASSLRQTR